LAISAFLYFNNNLLSMNLWQKASFLSMNKDSTRLAGDIGLIPERGKFPFSITFWGNGVLERWSNANDE